MTFNCIEDPTEKAQFKKYFFMIFMAPTVYRKKKKRNQIIKMWLHMEKSTVAFVFAVI